MRSRTAFRTGAEKGLAQAYEAKRMARQQLSAQELAAERSFGTAVTYVVNYNGGMAGLIETDLAFGTLSSTRARLDGSCLFIYE